MTDRRIKLRHLTCFLEVVRQRSVVRASEVLNLSQPAVSRSISELEDLLQIQLFDRSKRGAHLTEAGEILQRYTSAGIGQIEHGFARLQPDETAETLAVGALPNFGARFLPAILKRFRTDWPKSSVRVVAGANAELLMRLRRGEVDVVVGRLADAAMMKGLNFELLYMEPLVFVTRPGHPLAGCDIVELPQIARFTVLLPDRATIIRAEADRFFAAHGVPVFPDVIETIAFDFARAYVRGSDGVWLVPFGVVCGALEDGGLVRLPIATDELVGPVGLTTDPSRDQTLVAETFARRVREHLSAS